MLGSPARWGSIKLKFEEGIRGAYSSGDLNRAAKQAPGRGASPANRSNVAKHRLDLVLGGVGIAVLAVAVAARPHDASAASRRIGHRSF